MLSIILASASPSRKRLLEAAGIKPTIVVSNVFEEDPIYESMPPREMVIALAIVKAHTVREVISVSGLIIACDSTFEFEGESLGKPLTPEVARERSRKLSGKSGLLHTGHCIIDTEREIEISDIATTKVNFSELTDLEIDDYVASGEPLGVAGGFTLDGLSSAFISSIEGDYTNVIGLSIPLVRKMTTQLGYTWHDVTNQPDEVQK
ncbi:MAG TPA: nucleoside triphosphate pyrophosphatase [Candidatus Paceibacterota bacterium]|nr:nucleoside triphosphate pyrophosphatase [Candidatus Paceibacterota bacterium]